jgi:hypothetical protein
MAWWSFWKQEALAPKEVVNAGQVRHSGRRRGVVVAGGSFFLADYAYHHHGTH